MKRRLTRGSGRLSEKRRPRACQGTVGVCMGIPGCTRGERRDRAEVVLEKREFLSRVEEAGMRRMGLDGC